MSTNAEMMENKLPYSKPLYVYLNTLIAYVGNRWKCVVYKEILIGPRGENGAIELGSLQSHALYVELCRGGAPSILPSDAEPNKQYVRFSGKAYILDFNAYI